MCIRDSLFGMFDDDMNGKIEKAEFKGELGDRLAPYFAQMDANKSGGVENPELMMRGTVVVDNTITIPAGKERHQETAYVEFPKEALLYSAFPHAHYRGYASDLWLETPDGKKTQILAMPRYDFNWQREYTFAEPVKIPAGSRVIANYWYDNSKRNPANPDPSKTIVWGDQSWDCLLYTSPSPRDLSTSRMPSSA